MPSSSEEELDELLRPRIVRQPRNFAERRPLDTENPREFRQKFRLPVDAFAHLLELIGPQMEHRTRRHKGALTSRQQLLIFLYFLGTNSFYHVMHSGHEVSTSTFNNVANHWSCCPCNINPKARFHSMVWTLSHGCSVLPCGAYRLKRTSLLYIGYRDKFVALVQCCHVGPTKRNELVSTCRHRRKFTLRYNRTCESQRL